VRPEASAVSVGRAWVIGLALLALAGIGLVRMTVRHGVSLGSDSAAYFAAARNLVAGHGLSWLSGGEQARPLVLHAPLYPLGLALFELASIDLAAAAGWINAIAFGLSALVLALLIVRLTGSRLFALLGSLIFLLSGEMLQLHAWAMSDPIYLSLSLVAILLAGLFLADRRGPLLVLMALFASAAYLARYAGLALVVSLAIAVAVVPGAVRARRWVEAGVVLAVGVLPVGLWFARNQALTGQFAGRTLGWSGADAGQALDQTARVVLSWFAPTRFVDWMQAHPPVLTVAVLGLAVGTVLALGVAIAGTPADGRESRRALLIVLGMYLSAYFGLMAFSTFFSRPGTDLNARTLSPVYPILLALAVAALAYLGSSSKPALRWLGIGLCLLLLAGKAYDTLRQFSPRLDQPGGYASAAWKKSPTIAALIRRAPELVYTDDIAAVYLLANPNVLLVPLAAESATGEPRADYRQNLDTMRRRIRDGEAVLALFDVEPWPTEFAPLDELTSGLAAVEVLEDGVIYGASGG
jgi:hypothetical protein